MVIRQAGDAGAEHDVPGALGGGADEDFRRGDGFPARGVMLAHPDLVIAQVIEPLDELHVAVHRQGGVLAHPVEGRQENPELQSAMGPTSSVHWRLAYPAWVPCPRGAGASPLRTSRS